MFETILGLFIIITSLGGGVILLGVDAPKWMRIVCGIGVFLLFLSLMGLAMK